MLNCKKAALLTLFSINTSSRFFFFKKGKILNLYEGKTSDFEKERCQETFWEVTCSKLLQFAEGHWVGGPTLLYTTENKIRHFAAAGKKKSLPVLLSGGLNILPSVTF